MEVVSPRVKASPEPSVTLLISRGQKLTPTIKVCPAPVAWGSVSVTVPPEVGSRLKVAFWISEMAGGVVTENPLVRAPLWVSGLVTETLRVPTVAVELMAILEVSCVAELKVQEFTVIPAPKLQVAPLWKLPPEMMTLGKFWPRSEEHTSELQSLAYLVCRLLLEKKKQ